MSEGPQVKRKAEWMNWRLQGRRVLACRCFEPATEGMDTALTGRTVERVFPAGKHIFLELNNRTFIHNHLMMKGSWRKLNGPDDPLPNHTWMALDVQDCTLCNVKGQILELLDQDGVERILQRLGPDIMRLPLPRDAIAQALERSALPIAEALLDQSVLAGIGNIAKSEALFEAGIAPGTRSSVMTSSQHRTLIDAMARLCWASYRNRGRWKTQIYRKSGKPCPRCSHPIERIRLAPSRRATYFCPRCQPASGPTRQPLLFELDP